MTDVGTTKRKPMSKARQLRIFEARKGICITCGQQIRAGDRWFIEHIRALELGGDDIDENCAPAHYACKPEKDADDHHRAAKAKRVKQKHLRIVKSVSKIRSAPFPKSEKSAKRQPRQALPPKALYIESEDRKWID